MTLAGRFSLGIGEADYSCTRKDWKGEEHAEAEVSYVCQVY